MGCQVPLNFFNSLSILQMHVGIFLQRTPLWQVFAVYAIVSADILSWLFYLGNKVFPLFFAKIEDNSAPRGWAGKDDDGGIEEDFGGRRTLDWPDHENGVDFGDEEWDSDGESVGEVDEEMAAAVERELFS